MSVLCVAQFGLILQLSGRHFVTPALSALAIDAFAQPGIEPESEYACNTLCMSHGAMSAGINFASALNVSEFVADSSGLKRLQEFPVIIPLL